MKTKDSRELILTPNLRPKPVGKNWANRCCPTGRPCLAYYIAEWYESLIIIKIYNMGTCLQLNQYQTQGIERVEDIIKKCKRDMNRVPDT